jgi:hypothetical protein
VCHRALRFDAHRTLGTEEEGPWEDSWGIIGPSMEKRLKQQPSESSHKTPSSLITSWPQRLRWPVHLRPSTGASLRNPNRLFLVNILYIYTIFPNHTIFVLPQVLCIENSVAANTVESLTCSLLCMCACACRHLSTGNGRKAVTTLLFSNILTFWSK